MKKISREKIISTIKKQFDDLEDTDISPSAYDTAWVARIPSDKDQKQLMFPKTLEWILDNQNSDGSWGGSKSYPNYLFDPLIQTASVANTLAYWFNKGHSYLNKYLDSAINYLEGNINKLDLSQYKLAAFEILFPQLISKLNKELNLNLGSSKIFQELSIAAKIKVEKIAPYLSKNIKTTAIHSLEAFEDADVNWKSILELADTDGGFMTSSAASAMVYMKTKDERTLDYLKNIIKPDGSVAFANTFNMFEINWMLEAITNLGLVKYFEEENKKAINYLKGFWDKYQNISWSHTFNVPDLDDTAVTYYLLKKNGYEVSPKIFEYFVEGDNIFCFRGETEGAPTHLLHLLSALKEEKDEFSNGLKEKAIAKLKIFFKEKGWLDKWHLSKYYVIALSVNALKDYMPAEIERMYKFVVETQKENGSWNNDIEETAWGIMSMIYLNKEEQEKESIDKAIDFIQSNLNNTPYDPQWIGKVLYLSNKISKVLFNGLIIKLGKDVQSN